ncbi:MAG: hypothetical protein AMJ58_08550 [Gammaproteobacteria bacterium SG8_30]|nr:MAG: hypothetical protein AMJ58_08550 [Gammaproteobacteria bacterium SG8_30]
MLEERAHVAAPASVAWSLLTDTQTWPRWGPSVRGVDTPSRFIGAGVRGRVQTAIGLWLPFEVDDWEPGAYWHWRVGGVAATGHRVNPLDATSCEVVLTMPAWAPFYRPVCRVAIDRIARLAAVQTAARRH